MTVCMGMAVLRKRWPFRADSLEFYTLLKPCNEELIEKRSRFIATLVPYKDFQAVLAEIRLTHPKANHHVTAYRHFNEHGQVVESGKDDGEPAGTSGMPTLKTLIGANLMDVGVIVTRYFGGIKLGTGGLARAYSGATKAALQVADLVEWRQIETIELFVPFDRSPHLERALQRMEVSVISRNFQENGVEFFLAGPVAETQFLKSQFC